MEKISLLFLLFGATLSLAAKSNLVWPCHLKDYKCIQDNLAANSNCKRNVKGSVPKEFVIDDLRIETPYFNSSYVEKGLIVRNLDKCFVSQFFYNTQTDKAILGIDCPQLDLESDRELIRHQSLKEDTYYNYHIHGTYPLNRFTINLPTRTHMDLCKATVFTEVTALPKFVINPKDRSTANFLTRDLSELYIFEREYNFYLGYTMTRIFIDSVICDYGCPRNILNNYD